MHGVYFVTDGTAIKIGYSVDAEHRMADLQTSHHQDLRLIASFPGTTSDETRLHDHFSHLRIRGEWFQPAEDLLTFIAELESAAAVAVNLGRIRAWNAVPRNISRRSKRSRPHTRTLMPLRAAGGDDG